jgi:hypothetical protein
MSSIIATRRELLVAPLLAALPAAFLAGQAQAAGHPDPAMTIVRPPEEIKWEAPPGFPAQSVEMAPLWSKQSETGLYYLLVKWHPGYMSAPHWYATDRYCVVLSGIWWVASGEDFDAANTVPAGAGTFVRRVARTPHYDGVKHDGTEPAVIAICGIGPIKLMLNDESKPAWRAV